jgi:Macrocin-O-methyltransferase (TylF)
MLGEAALTRVGARLSTRTVHSLGAAMNYVKVGHWMSQFDDPPRVETKAEMFDAILADVRDQRVLYLEFGVYQGKSVRWWASRLTHPESMLHGFDSFQGLPATWTPRMGKGHFDTSGQVPQIADERVRFFPGWFSDTLPVYEWPESYDRLVVNVDADLYSSTVEVLAFVEERLVPGSFIYFDEFNDANHEQRAFAEFVERTGMQFRPVAATIEYGNVAFERMT